MSHRRHPMGFLVGLAAFAVVAFAAQPPAPAGTATPAPLSGVVFLDQNGNGVRDAGETGVGGARVSDQRHTVLSGADGRWTIAARGGYGLVNVGAPAGHRVAGAFWKWIDAGGPLDFALVTAPNPTAFRFVHASDPHTSPQSVERLRAARAIVERLQPDFVLMTGDLVRDALRVGEEEARGYYDLYVAEIARFPVPVWNVPGNHEIFGVERHLSLVSPQHPLYGKGMYRRRLGPNYYSFDWGGVHFVGLDTVDVDDLWYYGHVDATQLEWLAGDLATVPATTPVVTFNHIPFVTAVEDLAGYRDDPPAPTVIEVGSNLQFRHSVANFGEVLAKLAGHPFPLALGGHMHAREILRYEAGGVTTRFEQAAAIVGPNEAGPLTMTSGMTLYQVDRGRIDAGTFLPLDAPAGGR
ncbi:MAG TPA: metallophosphoesterase [Solirubrobacterales bacterium]